MKKILLLLVVPFFVGKNCEAQNLVPNPSFEDTHNVIPIGDCPYDIGLTTVLNDWIYSSFSPDYFSRCDTINHIVSVPYNIWGFQESSSNSYIGMYIYARGVSPNYREIIGANLIDSLIIGNRYFVKMKISHSNCLRCIANNIGLLTTTIPIQLQNPVSLPNHSQLHSLSIISDTLNWVELAGSFIADSNYKYVFVGNFYDDFNTDTLITSCSWCPLLFPDSNVFAGDTVFCTAYYYVDDVCVSPDSLACDLNPEGIYDFKKGSADINIYPNPASSELTITSSQQSINTIAVFDLMGKTVASFPLEAGQVGLGVSGSLNLKSKIINLKSFSPGVYFIKLQLHDGSWEVRRFVKE